MHQIPGAERPRDTARPRRWLIPLIVVAIVLLLLGRYAWLGMMATEGDVPPASAIPLPGGAQITAERKDCASGGCWLSVDVVPPPGVSPEQLEVDLGIAPQREIPGTVLDPRSVWLGAEAGAGILTIRADYWSRTYVP